MSLSNTIASNVFSPPSMQDATFNIWFKKGLRYFKDLFIEDKFASFAQLSSKFDLPTSNFFRYLQARHYVSDSVPGFPDKPDNSIIDENQLGSKICKSQSVRQSWLKF